MRESGAARRVALYDGASGAQIAVLAEGDSVATRRARFLSDGRVALVEGSRAGSRLRLFSREGREELSLPLPGADAVAVGGEPAPGRLWVATKLDAPGAAGVVAGGRAWKLAVVDLAAGSVREVATGIWSPNYWPGFSVPPSVQPAPGAPGTRLLVAADLSLVRVDPESGQVTKVVGGEGR